MGLIKAAVGAAGGVLADQWLEFFTCDAIPADTLMVKGRKSSSGRSSNDKGSENVISNGSKIAVADGQCMVIVEQGKVVDLCAEPGEYTYDLSTEPSVFYGDLKESVIESLKTMGKRFTFGGDAAKDQRVYYFNTKELIGNKYGTPQPVPFRVIDERAGIDMDVSLSCFGEYSYRICDPILFYANVCANVSDVYKRDQIEGQLKSELLAALQPAFARISENGVRYSQLPAHTTEITNVLNEELSNKWRALRGIEIVSFGMSSVRASDEDEANIKEMQRAATYMDPAARAGLNAVASAQAMKDAAKNEGGAMNGFIGMGLAQQQMNAYANVGGQAAPVGQTVSSGVVAAPANGWTCACGAVNTGNFCADCGSAKPAPAAQWTCSCGSVNTGKFCPNCGAAMAAAAPKSYQCSNCGFTPEDPANPPKFCPQCGDPFNEADAR